MNGIVYLTGAGPGDYCHRLLCGAAVWAGPTSSSTTTWPITRL